MRVMGGEPWCLDDFQIARMTDEQIDARVKYAVEQAEKAKHGKDETPQDPFPDGLPDTPQEYADVMGRMYPDKAREYWFDRWIESRSNIEEEERRRGSGR